MFLLTLTAKKKKSEAAYLSLPWQIDLRFLGKLILKMKNRRIVAKTKRCKVAITWKFKTQQQFCYHINVIIIIFSICNEEFGVSTTPHGCSFNFNVVALELFDFAMWLNYRDRLFFIHSFFFFRPRLLITRSTCCKYNRIYGD